MAAKSHTQSTDRTTDRCPVCGRAITAISTVGPTEHVFQPCGHRAPPEYALLRAGGR